MELKSQITLVGYGPVPHQPPLSQTYTTNTYGLDSFRAEYARRFTDFVKSQTTPKPEVSMKPFLYVVYVKPTDSELKKGETPKIVAGLDVVLAHDEKHASLLAGRAIPDTTDLNRVEVVVRPF